MVDKNYKNVINIRCDFKFGVDDKAEHLCQINHEIVTLEGNKRLWETLSEDVTSIVIYDNVVDLSKTNMFGYRTVSQSFLFNYNSICNLRDDTLTCYKD